MHPKFVATWEGLEGHRCYCIGIVRSSWIERGCEATIDHGRSKLLEPEIYVVGSGIDKWGPLGDGASRKKQITVRSKAIEGECMGEVLRASSVMGFEGEMGREDLVSRLHT